MKINMGKLLLTTGAVFLISCNTADTAGLEQSLNEIKDDQKVILKKLETLDKAVANVALANINKPSNPNTQKKQPPKPSGPWKRDYTYETSAGNSYYMGPENAKVVITEWSDYF